jgi:type II secretory pathway component GspD/PulD (secretin)
MRRFLLFLLFFSSLAVAQQAMEIIPLKHRTVDQVIPALQPFVEPGGALSGMNNQLILRGSAKNREQIRQALAAMDTPLRRLVIRVSQNRDAESRQQGSALSASVGGNHSRITGSGAGQGGAQIDIQRGDSRVSSRVYDTRSTREAQSGQSVQVVEGGRAFIQVGQSLPLPLRQLVLGPNGAVLTESVVYHDIGQGFHATPRLAGDRVMLEISPQFDTPGNQGYGSVNTQRISTTVSGQLGEWIELGGSGQQTSGSDRSGMRVGTSEIRDNRSVWLLVEELK